LPAARRAGRGSRGRRPSPTIRTVTYVHMRESSQRHARPEPIVTTIGMCTLKSRRLGASPPNTPTPRSPGGRSGVYFGRPPHLGVLPSRT
jgi:hypothetical protein